MACRVVPGVRQLFLQAENCLRKRIYRGAERLSELLLGLLWMQSRSRHDGPTQFLGRERNLLRAVLAFGDKTIPPPHDCLQESRLRRVILQRDADLANRSVDSLLHVDEDILAPERVCNLLTRHQLALVVDKIHQKLQWQTFQAHTLSGPRELELSIIEFELAEANLLIRHESRLFRVIFPILLHLCL